MRLLVLLYIVIFNPLLLSAQIRGTVTDGQKKLPLAGVNIYLQKDTTGISVTDKNGEFKIAHPEKIDPNDTITFSYLSYLPFKCTLWDLKHLDFRVMMYEHPQLLSEVTVQGERGRVFLNGTYLSRMPKRLYSFGGFLSDGKIYVVAGDETLVENAPPPYTGRLRWEYHSRDMYIYDIKKNETTTEKLNLTPRACHAAHLYKNKIFILGGKRYSVSRKIEYTDATVEIYDMDKDTLYVDPVNPHKAVDFTSFIYNDHLYVMGGAEKEKVFSDKIHTLDLKTGVWYELEDKIPAECRGRLNGILVGEKVYFVGGYRSTPLWTVTSYDLKTGEWKHLCNLKDGVAYPGLANSGSLIYIFEGNNLQVYNITTNAVDAYKIILGVDNSEGLDLNMENSGLYYLDKKLYLVGGCSRNGDLINPSSAIYSVDVSHINM